jgi:hypothetical protein
VVAVSDFWNVITESGRPLTGGGWNCLRRSHDATGSLRVLLPISDLAQGTLFNQPLITTTRWHVTRPAPAVIALFALAYKTVTISQVQRPTRSHMRGLLSYNASRRRSFVTFGAWSSRYNFE